MRRLETLIILLAAGASQARGGQDATLAQPVEQLIRNQQVVGSNPTVAQSIKINEFSDHIEAALVTGRDCSSLSKDANSSALTWPISVL